MKTQIEKKEKTISLKVELPAEKVEAERARLFNKYLKELAVPGFRKGKVPPKIAQRYLPEEALFHEIIENLVPPALNQALRKENLIPLTTPTFDFEELKKDTPLIFTTSFEVKPEIEIKDYKGIKVTALESGLKEEEIEAVLNNLQQSHGKMLPITEDRGLKEGDFALIDFESFIQQKPVPQGKSENFALELKADRFIPGFMEKMLGMKKGEQREFTITFPLDYATDLRGKEVDFKVDLKEIKGLELPEFNDDFAKSVSAFPSLSELKEKITRDLTTRKEMQANFEIEEKILTALIPQLTDPIPPAYLEYQREYLLRDIIKQLAWSGETLEGFLKKQGATPEQLKAQLTPQAERLAKEELIIDAVARMENLEISPEEVENEIQEFARRTSQPAEKIKTTMEKEDTLDMFSYNLLKGKTRKLLRENAEIEYQKITESESPEQPAKTSKKKR